MEEKITKIKKPIVVDIMPVEPTTYSFRDRLTDNKKPLLIIGGVVLVLALGIGAWLLIRPHIKKTPEQTLQALEKSSEPIIASPDERANALQASSAKSTPVKASKDDRLNMLNALK